jgi:hypothetical protein
MFNISKEDKGKLGVAENIIENRLYSNRWILSPI